MVPAQTYAPLSGLCLPRCTAVPGPVYSSSASGTLRLTSPHWRVSRRQGSAVQDSVRVSTYIKRGLLRASVSLHVLFAYPNIKTWLGARWSSTTCQAHPGLWR